MKASKPALEDYLVLILLSAIWGASFLFLRIASPVFGPFFLIEMRVASALLVLLPVCFVLGKQHEIIANWRPIFLLSICNMTVPFCLLAYATLSIGAGFASIINATDVGLLRPDIAEREPARHSCRHPGIGILWPGN